jgi:hypothetical protein
MPRLRMRTTGPAGDRSGHWERSAMATDPERLSLLAQWRELEGYEDRANEVLAGITKGKAIVLYKLRELGLGTKKISAFLGITHNQTKILTWIQDGENALAEEEATDG